MARDEPKKGGKQSAPYNFAPTFERTLVVLACIDPRFMARTAIELNPELLGSPECKLALAAAQEHHRETGRGTENPAAVIQRVARRRDDGKAKHEEVMAVAALFDELDGKPRPRIEEFEMEAVHVLRARLRHAIAQAAIDEHNVEEWNELHKLLAREQRLGRAEDGIGVWMTEAKANDAIRRLLGLQRIPLGIDALDEAMSGGVPNGTLTCFMAPPGGAKSMALSHSTAQMSMKGLFGAYATLELPTAFILARILACQTGVTIDEVTNGTGLDRVWQILGEHGYTPPVVQDFAPHVTTWDSIAGWADEIEQKAGRKLDFIVVDYADKLTSTGKLDEKGMYQEMRVVYEEFRIWCDGAHRQGGLKTVGLTASQSRARDEKKSKRIDIEHVADSMHKARVVDHFITLNYDEETNEMSFFLAKNRYGEGRKSIGPVPSNFASGQVAPVARKFLGGMAPKAQAALGAFDAVHRLTGNVTQAAEAAVSAGGLPEVREPGSDEDESGSCANEGAEEAPF